MIRISTQRTISHFEIKVMISEKALILIFSFVIQPTGAVYWTELQSLYKQLHSSSHFVNIEFHVFLRLGKIYFYIQRCQIRYFAEFLLREHFIFRSIQLMKILRR